METLSFTMPVQMPFRLDLTVWELRRRPDNAVDRWDGGVYRRTLVLQGRPLEIAVIQTAPADRVPHPRPQPPRRAVWPGRVHG
jgi:DNA-3-methyladenine glycosylase II